MDSGGWSGIDNRDKKIAELKDTQQYLEDEWEKDRGHLTEAYIKIAELEEFHTQSLIDWVKSTEMDAAHIERLIQFLQVILN